MRKLFSLITIIFSVALFSSCDLDTSPSDGVTDETAFESEEAAQVVLTGAYDWLSDGYYNHTLLQEIFFDPDMMGEDCFVASVGHYNRFIQPYQYNIVKTQTTALNPWITSYAVIDNTNAILDNIESLTETSERNRIQGEAYALRAYAYHFIVRLYAKAYKTNPNAPGVVLRTTSSYNGIPRSTVADAYTLMVGDLKEAVRLLQNVSTSTPTTIDKRAAEAILARVYLDMGENTLAIQHAKNAAAGITLMSQADYPTAKFSDYNSESLWAFEASSSDNNFYVSIPSFYYTADGGYYDKDGELQFKNYVDGYNSLRVSKNLIDLFDDADVRKKQFPKIDGTDEYLNDETAKAAIYTTKFRSRNNQLGEGAINLLRASEMYLIIAEAAADEQDYTQARTALNTIRTTRGLGDYSGSDASLVDEIQFERRRELFAEGHRLFDIKRRGLPLTRSVNGVLMQGHWAVMDIPANSDKFEYPIPQKEIDANSEMSEADQNPGFE